ncbi:MAG: DUF4190 domain-containing protein [Phycisphaerae bacterium]|jgi:uncharacterized membrane protein (UPF0136 family)
MLTDHEHITVTRKNSLLAIISLISAILGIVLFLVSFLFGFFKGIEVSAIPLLIALVLGLIAVFMIGIRRKRTRGLVYAIIAILLAFPSYLFVYTFSTLPERRAIAEKTNTARYNMKQLYKAVIKYCENNDGYLPVADRWCDLLMQTDNSLTKATFKHPRIEKGECNIAFNKNLSSLKLSKIPKNVVLLFEADGDWNLTGSKDLFEQRYKNDKQCLFTEVLLTDGSLKTYGFERKEPVRFGEN